MTRNVAQEYLARDDVRRLMSKITVQSDPTTDQKP